MKRILYTSRATQPLTTAALERLIAHARQHNTTIDVTGLLVSHNGSYMQLLEGPDEAVDRLFGTISGDHRHTRVMVHAEEPISQRSCPHWRMGLSVPEPSQWLEGVSAVRLPQPLLSLDLIESPITAELLMAHYVKLVAREQQNTAPAR